ncbi:hypothetical protein [Dyadobacter frigoris]|uniref:HTH cro/C1-type domain-containing protein n=1 Tax=Dyadobacter frigoris TaxID=2576211 RepID=A0A4U6CN02_9BACT|nr:hypothetical protein [Dyadobacter frigoris]TKT85729.1 hypothetical protein FDK13_33385 [Dyadobacter frigoris]
MEGDSKRIIQLKCALTLNKFLEENKLLSSSNKKRNSVDLMLVDNLSKLSSLTGLRSATISSIFNADSIPSITTIIVILAKLRRTLVDFGSTYDSIEDQEIEIFQTELNKKKEYEKNRKTI